MFCLYILKNIYDYINKTFIGIIITFYLLFWWNLTTFLFLLGGVRKSTILPNINNTNNPPIIITTVPTLKKLFHISNHSDIYNDHSGIANCFWNDNKTAFSLHLLVLTDNRYVSLFSNSKWIKLSPNCSYFLNIYE